MLIPGFPIVHFTTSQGLPPVAAHRSCRIGDWAMSRETGRLIFYTERSSSGSCKGLHSRDEERDPAGTGTFRRRPAVETESCTVSRHSPSKSIFFFFLFPLSMARQTWRKENQGILPYTHGPMSTLRTHPGNQHTAQVRAGKCLLTRFARTGRSK